jgi:antitoxin PrlF
VTIPKKVRDALHLSSGSAVEFSVGRDGDVVLRKVGAKAIPKKNRFEVARGKAQIKWRTDKLMALLRD